MFTRKVLVLVVLAALCCGCTARQWRISDPAPWLKDQFFSHQQLEAMADTACPLDKTGMLAPEFVSDGCSAWPDGESYLGCCVRHDMAYWCGGTASLRRQADRELRRCVAESSNAFNAWSMYLGTRVGGHPFWPMPWRWGYGRRWQGRHWEYPAQSDSASQP